MDFAPAGLDLAERTYFRYRDEVVELLDTSVVSRALAFRYGCEPISLGQEVFPVTVLWRNRENLIDPDTILGRLDSPPPEPLTSSATLSEAEYASARAFIASLWQAGPVRHEGLEYCMSAIDFGGALPRVDGNLGWYYDNILTQYGMEWELKKALKQHGADALTPARSGVLPLREAVELGRNPLIEGGGRCTAMTVSLLLVFACRGQGFWTIIRRRSRAVGVSAGLLHVVPAGMFECVNPRERWSIRSAVWRETLEEVYGEGERAGDPLQVDAADLSSEPPMPFLFGLLREGRAELSLTGICCDLLNLRPEICCALFVKEAGLSEIREMSANWEYERQEPGGGAFATPWDSATAAMGKVRVGEIVPSGLACFELGRTWLQWRHGV